MKHVSQTAFARAKSAAPEVLEQGPDKWVLLGRLTAAADHYALSHRTLSVLKALLTFLPSRHIPSGPAAVVFPANRTLSHRLSGMPESTLRRHIALLVKAGIVNRQDSPNRKRFARHRAGTLAIAYGFDLSPLARMEDALEAQAAQAHKRQEALAILRCHVLDLRALVISRTGESTLTDEAARVLRRKPAESCLREMLEALEAAASAAPFTQKTSGCDNENERHIQADLKYSSRPRRQKNTICLSQVLHHCEEFQSYFTQKIRNWQDLLSISQRVAPMIGLDGPTVDKVQNIIGRHSTCVAILCILERFQSIENPNAYLMSLIKQAQSGAFSLDWLLKGGNSENCQLTTF